MKLKQILLIIGISSVSAVGSVAIYNQLAHKEEVSYVGTVKDGKVPVNYAGFFDGKTGTAADPVDFTKAANAAVPAVVHIKTKIPAKKVTND
ncbi:MAG TPA: serine protease, partial [Chitinophagaceae bacterium]|nr:serine protease [Chitinophagaceae bacterium]